MTIDDQLDEVAMNTLPEGEFEGEVFLSTDGKQTVHVKADTEEGRKAALAWAKEVYDRIVERYGTKQAQAVKEYSKDVSKEKQENCEHIHTSELTVKNGKNAGRKFSKCDDCQKFLKFVS